MFQVFFSEQCFEKCIFSISICVWIVFSNSSKEVKSHCQFVNTDPPTQSHVTLRDDDDDSNGLPVNAEVQFR